MRTRFLRRALPAVLFLAMMPLAPSAAPAKPDADLQTLKQRLMDETLRGRLPSEEAIRSYMEKLQPDGSFSDVDYRTNTRVRFGPLEHLRRVHRMALAWRVETHAMHGDPALLKATLDALHHWLDHQYENPNWWFQTIGIPRTMFRILFLLEGQVGNIDWVRALELVAKGKIGMTGQNLVWVSDITAARGCLEGDPELVQEAFDAIANTIVVSGDEGIQADWSFYQHGPCLYSGGYGQGFAGDTARYAVLGKGTRFAFPDEKLEMIEHLILDGTQWMMRGKYIDYGAKGREISRKRTSAAGIRGAAERMASLGRPRTAEFKALAARVAHGTAPDGPNIEGNRMFWRSDFMVHRRRGYLTSAKMHSKRIANTDAPCNSEGLLSYYLSDGCNYIFRRGDEYDMIFGSWDWKRIPGCTIEQKPLKGNPRRMGTTDFAGGVSDGDCGAAGFDFERDGLTARKAWFYFDREYVCLGAGITLARADYPVLTSVNQTKLRGDVTVWRKGVEGAVKPQGEETYDDLAAVWHDGVAYAFAGQRGVTVKNEPQPTSWYRINHRYKKKGDPVDVFSAWIDHGKAPSGATYAYTVAPDIQAGEVADWIADPQIEIVANTPEVQAVYHRGQKTLGLIFYRAGRIHAPEWGHVALDQPGAVLLRDKDGKITVSAANPECEEATFHLTVGTPLEGPGATSAKGGTTIELELPGGLFAGQSVTNEYRRGAH